MAHNAAGTAAGDSQLTHEANRDIPDCIELVTRRRMPSGAATRFIWLQSLVTGKFAVAAVNMFTEEGIPAPSWIDVEAHRQVAGTLQLNELHWHESAGAAMDAWVAR